MHRVSLHAAHKVQVGYAVTFCFISGGLIPLVVSLLEIIRNNMFAAVTFATVRVNWDIAHDWLTNVNCLLTAVTHYTILKLLCQPYLVTLLQVTR